MKNLIRLAAAGIAATILLSQAGVANAAEVKVLAAVAVKGVLSDLVTGFERTTNGSQAHDCLRHSRRAERSD
jgi:ABC-type molybdate transport system substrate-binding protein